MWLKSCGVGHDGTEIMGGGGGGGREGRGAKKSPALALLLLEQQQLGTIFSMAILPW